MHNTNDQDLQGSSLVHARVQNVAHEADLLTEFRKDGVLGYYSPVGDKRLAVWDVELNKYVKLARPDRCEDGPVNVLHPRFGAMGDGVTDDTIAIQAVLDYVADNGGGTVFFPPGTYLFSSQIVLPATGAKIAIVGSRRYGTRLLYSGSDSPAITSSALTAECGFLFGNICISGAGNSNPDVDGLSIIGEGASRNLVFENVEIHQFAYGTGLIIDSAHTLGLRDVLIHYCKRAAELGENGFCNAVDIHKLSIEVCTDADYVVLIKNALGVNWLGGTLESNVSGIRVQDSEMVLLQGLYHEYNGPTEPYIQMDLVKCGVVRNNYFNGSNGSSDTGIRLGSNSVAGLSNGYLIEGNFFYQLDRCAIEFGVGGVGPRAPIVRDNVYYATPIPFLFTTAINSGGLLDYHTGLIRFFNATGTELWRIGGARNGSDSLILDFGGVTSGGISLPGSSSYDISFWTVSERCFTYDTTLHKPIWFNGTAWQSCGTSDLAASGTATDNYFPKWATGALSGTSLLYADATAVGINTNAPAAGSRFHVKDGAGSVSPSASSSVIIENSGTSGAAYIAEFISGSGAALRVTNAGTVTLPQLTASALLKLNGSKEMASTVAYDNGSAIGIATASPTAGSLLHVKAGAGGTAASASTLLILETNGTSGSSYMFEAIAGGGTALKIANDRAVNFPALTASQFVRTDASKNLETFDLLGSANSWTATQTFATALPSFVGINTSPAAGSKLHVKDGAGGVSPSASTVVIIEGNGTSGSAYMLEVIAGGGAALKIANDRAVNLPALTASKYVKTDASKNLSTGDISAGDLPTAIDAAKIADGTVSSAEFQHLNGVTSAIQTQLDGKSSTGHGHAATDISGLVKTLTINATPAGNVTTGEDDLITYSVGAGVSAGVGARLKFKCSGDFAANSNNKTVKAYFGATVMFSTGALAFNAGIWAIDIEIIRTGPTTQRATLIWSSSNTTLSTSVSTSTPAETLSGAVVFKLTGEATATSDIVQNTLTAELWPL